MRRDDETGKSASEITERTRVPLSLVIGIVAATVTVSGMFLSINYRLGNIERNQSQGWSYEDMQKWSLKLQTENPNIKVPIPPDSRRVESRYQAGPAVAGVP